MPKLEIGADLWPHPGYEYLDVKPREGLSYKVDIVASAEGPIPRPDNHYDEILASHILEHLPDENIDKALREWLRILKPGGRLDIRVPDTNEVCKAYLEQKDLKLRWEIQRIWYGVGLEDWRLGHKVTFDKETLTLRLQSNGFVTIRELVEIKDRHDEGWEYTGVKKMSLKLEAFKSQ